MMSLVKEDEDSQKNGMCGIVYLIASTKMDEMDIDMNLRTPQMADWYGQFERQRFTCARTIISSKSSNHLF